MSLVTLFPELYTSFLQTSLLKKAQEQNIVSFCVRSLFEFCQPKQRVDSPTFGHGAGMLLRPEIVEQAVEAQEAYGGPAYKIFFSPQGKKLDQVLLRSLVSNIYQRGGHVLLMPARYEGMDARVEEYYADCIVSIGDFVLMGGDLPAMVLLEGLLRLIPGIVGKQESVEHESFSGPFLDYPEYTEPVVWRGYAVPEVIRSGNHEKIKQWRQSQAIAKTVYCNFEWLRSHITAQHEIAQAADYIPAHYAVLMHTHVLLPDGEDKQEGTSSVTSLDIHDIARSAATYTIKNYFIVTPLQDQQRIVAKLLAFWRTQEGVAYNPHRHRALERVILVSSLQEACASIAQAENAQPVLLATGAQKKYAHDKKTVTYYDQATVWSLRRPVVFVFGTARGLGPTVIQQCDFILEPLRGFTDFNHLSVRSAAAVVFDRWLGVNSVYTIDK